MIEFLKKDRWSPYLAGAFIGLLLVVLFLIGNQIGVSTGIARIGALIEYGVDSSHVKSTPYFQGLLANKIIFDWKVLFVIGIFFGSLIASKLSYQKTPRENTIWERVYGYSKSKRYIAAFIGGIILMVGARLANGCTSGHAISGGAQLSLTSWVFMLAVFTTAIPMSFLLYRR